MKITIINGPNLNLLGSREPDVYGLIPFQDFYEKLLTDFPHISFDYHQSNIEGEIVNFIQQAGINSDGIVLNAGGYSHTSVAIADAVKAIKIPVVEVHISNIYSREEFRKTLLIAAYCKGIISGFGLNSYRLAIQSLLPK